MLFLNPALITEPTESLLKVELNYAIFPRWNDFESTSSLWRAGLLLKLPFAKKIAVGGFFTGSRWWWKLGGEGFNSGSIRFSLKGKTFWGAFGSIYKSYTLDYCSTSYIYSKGWNPFLTIGAKFRIRKVYLNLKAGFVMTGSVYFGERIEGIKPLGKNLSLEAYILKSEESTDFGASLLLGIHKNIHLKLEGISTSSLVWENDNGTMLSLGLTVKTKKFSVELLPSMTLKPIKAYGILIGAYGHVF